MRVNIEVYIRLTPLVFENRSKVDVQSGITTVKPALETLGVPRLSQKCLGSLRIVGVYFLNLLGPFLFGKIYACIFLQVRERPAVYLGIITIEFFTSTALPT